MEEDHVHCISCYTQRCTVRPQPGISCDLLLCPMVCGAIFHSCKADEHQLVCPLIKVPCLNRDYGCQANLTRNQMYSHLEVCPAGVVCCTMEWNRWPVSSLDYTSYESLSRGVEEAEQLDMALALQDQCTLLESLKVIAMAPTVGGAQGVPVKKEDRATDFDLLRSACDATVIEPSLSSSLTSSTSLTSRQPQASHADSAKERIASGINGLNEEHFSKLYEATVETARSLVAALEIVSGTNSVESGADRAKVATAWRSRSAGDCGGLQNCQNGGPNEAVTEERRHTCSTSLREDAALHAANGEILNATKEPLSGQTKTSCQVVGQGDCGDAALARERVDTVPEGSHAQVCPGVAHRAERVIREGAFPTSERHRNRFPPSGQTGFRSPAETQDKSTDTSDLERENNDDGGGEVDPISAALLFCLEESRECRRISDAVRGDGRRRDFGTQTFTFPAAILLTGTRVGDVASASACDHAAAAAAPHPSQPSPFHSLRLGLVLEALEVEAVPHGRYLPANPRYRHVFPFVCGQPLRRDQFSAHFTNVHGDIHAALNGWMEHRCPLAYYGCTFSQRRFYPCTPGARVVHSRHLRAFGVQPCPSAGPPGAACHSDRFSDLPLEVLRHIARYLDSFSLCQLSLVSWTLREVCASLLESRGIVELQWERTQRPGASGSVVWQVKKKVSRNVSRLA